ncbi:4Fe-4S dicluster domain-containing protein [bacterium]|nr:MAG: 4Fe-4S dicluster domain-containing protein [bacterium]
MKGFDYLGLTTLKFDRERCVGCFLCLDVCPHSVFEASDRKVSLVAPKKCIECGACARNCPAGAISVKPGVGCAEAILRSWISGAPPD